MDDFQDVEDLANFIKLLDNNNKLYKQFLAFKDEPIKNKNLINILSTRDWRPDICDKSLRKNKIAKTGKFNSIFTGFECFLCNKVTEMTSYLGYEKLDSIYVAEPSDYKCPSPMRFDEHGRYTVHNAKWASDWNYGRYEADALEELYQEQKVVPQKDFDKLVKQQIKNDKPD